MNRLGRRAAVAAHDPVLSTIVAGALVGAAVQVRLSRYDGLALTMAVAGVLFLVQSVRSAGEGVPSRLRRPLVTGLLAVQVCAFIPLATKAFGDARTSARVLAVLAGVVVVALAADQVRARPGTGAWGRSVLVLAVGVMGMLWVTNVPTNIDVFHFQEVGAGRLLSGENPYAPGYPNPYGGAETDRFYAPGLSVDGVLQFGYPYPPLSLLLAVPGHLLGDVRVAHLLAVMAAGWLLLHMVEDSWHARAGGLLFLTSPMLLPLVQRGWTEAFLILALVATVWVLRRGSGHTTAVVTLGLFVAVKQYTALFLPVLLVVGPRWCTAVQRWRVAWQAVAVATVVTLPLALWSFGDFLYSVVLLQFRQPFRDDAMSLPAQAVRLWAIPGEAVALIGIVVAIALALWWVLRRAPRTWAGAAAGSALVMLAFLLFNKQAFTNYYLFAVAATWLSVAVHADTASPDAVDVRR